MMEEEDEVLFDQTTLLTNRVKASQESKNPGKIFTTVCLCLAFFGLVSKNLLIHGYL